MAPYLRAANVTWAGLDLSDVKQMAFTPKEQEIFRLQAGDILLSEASGSPGEVGKPAIWADEIPGCCFQNTLIRVRQAPGSTKFLYFELLYFALSGRFRDDSKGVGIHHLGSERFSKIEVHIAPIYEQARIVAAIEQHLSDIDAGVAALERALANLNRYRAAVLKDACEGRLVPTEAEIARKEGREYEPAEVLLERILKERRERWEENQLAKMKAKGQEPSDDRWKEKYEEPKKPDLSYLSKLAEGWSWTTIEQCIVEPLCNGLSIKGSDLPPGVPALRLSAMSDAEFDYEDVRYLPIPWSDVADLQIRQGDFFVSRGNGTLRLVGRGTEAKVPPRDTIFPDTMIRLRFFEAVQKSHWLARIWSSILVRRQVELKAKTTAGIWKISQDDLSSITLPLPPLAEQRRIIAEVDRLLSVADTTEQATRAQLTRAKRLRQAVLKCAFEGKLVPQIPGEEPVVLLAPSPGVSSQPAKKSSEKANGAAPNMRTRTPKTPERASDFRPLEEVLAAHASSMTPEALFSAAGYAAEHVDGFYTELRRLELAGKIEEVRSATLLIRLRKVAS